MYKWEPYMMEYNSKLGEHPLCERCVFNFEDSPLLISVNITKLKKFKPYFKVKKYDENNNLIGLCRISFYAPKYIVGYDENMILTKEEIYFIMSELIFQRWRPKGFNNWQWLISEYNDIIDQVYNIKLIMPWMPIPNYNLLLRKEA